jgi:hypothetical protein
MSYWDGTHWVREDAAPEPEARTSRRRHALEAIAEGTLVALLTVGLIAGTAFAGKGGNPGGNGNGRGNNTVQGAGMTFTASPNVLHSGDMFDVSGCGFDTSLGNVVVGFTGGSWGSPLDSGGCFTIAGIPALSGDILPAGTYGVTAFQNVRDRWKAVASTTVTVVE